MKHYILAKFLPQFAEKLPYFCRIEEIFATVGQIHGIHSAKVYTNCIDRENRYDIMIVLDMEKEALPAWDSSEQHQRWKTEFGPLLEKKAIFDHE